MKSRSSTKRIIPLIIALIAVGAAFVFYLRSSAVPKSRDYVEAVGVIEAAEVRLSAKTSGAIGWLCCREGDNINAGDEAARLDNRELLARLEERDAVLKGAVESLNAALTDVDNARAQSEAARFEQQGAQGEVRRITAFLDEAKAGYERAKSLFDEGFLTLKDIDGAKTSLDALLAQLDSAFARSLTAEANYRTSKAHIKSIEARVPVAAARKAQAEAEIKALKAALDDTVIRSPITGVAVYKAFEAGEFVRQGDGIYTVHDLKDIWARIDVEETDIGKIRLGQAAEVMPSGLTDKSYNAKVIEAGTVGGFATQRDVTRGRQDIKTFRVKAGIEKPDGRLKPGMTVNVRIYFR
ncbi:MAG: efflux RND transporter periplasmic adaptor subunit [Deltaproteobacteria bacterium]|nr:efflux RND transporter periplasmic adaptor subunit [Deltaproteobacteria bacterium]